MKKFYQVVGKICARVFLLFGVVILSALIVSWYYEAEKEELWFEITDTYNQLYERDQETLFEQYGIKQYDKLVEETQIRNI